MKAAARLLLILALVAPSFASAQAQAAPAPACRLFASATIVNYNTKVRLDWDSRNATGGYLTDVGAISPDGYAYVVPGKNTTYAASFTGPGGTIVCRVAVAVRSGGPGSSYGGGVVNIDGTADYQSTSTITHAFCAESNLSRASPPVLSPVHNWSAYPATATVCPALMLSGLSAESAAS